jgi:hypothetical protein
MSHRFLGCLVVGVVLIAGASCTRLGEPASGEQTLALQTLTKTDSIPAAWGKLVSVSNSPGIADLVQLWFQDDAGIIRMAHYNVKDNYLSKQFRMIGRD